MCGIFGIIFDDGTSVPEQHRLDRSVALLAHQGPDGRGTHREPGIGLGHSRLSLVDLSPASDQPFWDEAGRFCVIYNGEIYNFRGIRGDLERRGATFSTTGDMEVLLQSLIIVGAEAILMHGRHPFLRDKWVLRKIADRYLPKEISRRGKGPFPSTRFAG